MFWFIKITIGFKPIRFRYLNEYVVQYEYMYMM